MRLSPRHARVLRAAALRSAARAALDAARLRRSVSLTIVVTGDAALRQLNRDFLGIDTPTDVLSFPSGADFPVGLERRHAPRSRRHTDLGDVVISLARARAQAKSGGHPLIDELCLLVIHSVLHLLGYDHETPEQKKRMWAAQARALKQTGASIAGPAE